MTGEGSAGAAVLGLVGFVLLAVAESEGDLEQAVEPPCGRRGAAPSRAAASRRRCSRTPRRRASRAGRRPPVRGHTPDDRCEARFSEDVRGVTGTTFTPRNPVGALWPRPLDYEASVRRATHDLGPDLAPDTRYAMSLTGGSTAIRDRAGIALPTSWSFTTRSRPRVTPSLRPPHRDAGPAWRSGGGRPGTPPPPSPAVPERCGTRPGSR